MVMHGLLQRIEGAHDLDEVAAVLSLLSGIVRRGASPEASNVRVLQEASCCLTRVRLVVNGLLRDEVLSRGASRAAADRYAEIEYAMRSVSEDIEKAMSSLASRKNG